MDKGLFLRRDFEGGQMSQDLTLFVDEDEIAYHIFSSEDNTSLHIAELADDYQGYTGEYIRIFPAKYNEAPAILRKDGTCFMIASGCTGWKPNEARTSFRCREKMARSYLWQTAGYHRIRLTDDIFGCPSGLKIDYPYWNGKMNGN